MSKFLQGLLTVMFTFILLTILKGYHFLDFLHWNHITLAIPTLILVIFVQAFVMHFFIGIHHYIENIKNCVSSEENIKKYFDNPPNDLTPYIKLIDQLYSQSQQNKRQVIPWCILLILLSMAAFLLGGAHDTGLVVKEVHAGVALGFFVASLLAFFSQWHFLNKSNMLLRKAKSIFSLPDHLM
jgi:hypothetical protein